MYKKSLMSLALGSAILTGAALAATQAPTNDDARSIVKQFFTQLKGELQKAMKAGGPVNAIAVCNEKAPQITHSVSQSTGWQVGRTSLKLRNPANAPEAWEVKVLKDFEAKKMAGADPKTLEYSEVVEIDGKKVFRYMKAIPTGKVCLKCHGKTLAPEVEAKLKALYPTDHARGYEVGDIRGAFVLEKTF